MSQVTSAVMPCGSKQGKDILFFNSFRFVFQKVLNAGEKRWTCAERGSQRCKVAVKTVGSDVVSTVRVHCHKADVNEQNRCLLRAAVKRKAGDDISTRPSQIVRTALSEFPVDVACADLGNLRRMAYNTQRKKIPLLPKNIEEGTISTATNKARANVKKVAMEDVSSKPADIINQSIANNELVGQKDVQSLRRAIYRTRVACQEKNSLDPLDISEPLTADALVGDGDCSQVELKLEVIDPAYEEETEHSKNVKELLNPGQETRPIADNDLNILPEITEEKPGFYNNVESAEPDSKRVKVETCDYRVDYPSESSSSFALAGSGRSSPSLMSCESRQIVGNSDDVEYVPQKVAASPAKRGLSSAPAPSGESATRSAERRDRSDIFGEYVAAKLRSLKTDAARNRVECLVANILYEASQGKFDNIDSNLDIAAELQAFLNSTKDLETLKIERGMDSSAVH